MAELRTAALEIGITSAKGNSAKKNIQYSSPTTEQRGNDHHGLGIFAPRCYQPRVVSDVVSKLVGSNGEKTEQEADDINDFCPQSTNEEWPNQRDEAANRRKLDRLVQYYDNGPLMRCLDADDEKSLQDLLYNRLFEEVGLRAPGSDTSTPEYWGEVRRRSYWAGVRAELRDAEGEVVEDMSAMAIDGSPSISLWSNQQNLRGTQGRSPDIAERPRRVQRENVAVDGKDVELIEIRAVLIEKMRSGGGGGGRGGGDVRFSS